MKPVLIDTGVLIALVDRSERRHAECVGVVDNLTVPLVTCEPVIAEACYLARRLPGAVSALLQNVSNGTLEIPVRLSEMAVAVQGVIESFTDRQVDLADACLVHLATQLGTGRILTLDSDFLFYRWSGKRPFEPLVPLVRSQ